MVRYMTTADIESEYTVHEGIFDAFHSEGTIDVELTGEFGGTSFSHDISVTHNFKTIHHDDVDEGVKEDSNLNWSEYVFVRRSHYVLDGEMTDYQTQFRYDVEDGRVEATGTTVDRAAEDLFDRTPLRRAPEFLIPDRQPSDAPPPVNHSTDWVSPRTLVTAILESENAPEGAPPSPFVD